MTDDASRLPGRGGQYDPELYKAVDAVLRKSASAINVTASSALPKVEKILGMSLGWKASHWQGVFPKLRDRFIKAGTCMPGKHEPEPAIVEDAQVLESLKIIVVYTDGTIGEYPSEADAIVDINLREHSASGVMTALIGRKLGMRTEKCERLLCFERLDEDQQGD